MAGEYAELIKGLGLELETMAKAMKDGDGDCDDKAKSDGAGDDKKIVAAAKDGEEISDADDKDKDMGKSFQMTLEDGTQVEAFDGTAAIAELVQQNAELRGAVEDLQKAFGAAVEVIKQVREAQTEQGTMIKSFGAKVSTAVSSPSGRRSMVSIIEKLSPAEAGKPRAEEGPNPLRLMAKARDLCQSGKMTWDQMSRIEAYQGRGMIAPPDILAHFPDLAS